MKRWIALLSLAAAPFATALAQDSTTQDPVDAPAPQAPMPIPPITVEVDGRIVDFPNAKPKAYTGRVLVPLRGVFQAIGAYVEYDPVTHMIKARRGNEELELRIGDRLAKKNGAEIMMDIAPVVDNGSAMVPLRFLAEALGAIVEYHKLLNKIVIRTPEREEQPPT